MDQETETELSQREKRTNILNSEKTIKWQKCGMMG